MNWARRSRRRFRRLTRAAVVALVALIGVGNAGLMGASFVVRRVTPSNLITLAGVPNLARVDDRLWRGGEPSDSGYRNLAAQGVTRVVDLAAGRGPDRDDRLLARLGVAEIEIPVTDGGLPSRAQVTRFLELVRTSHGRVFVHCRAGVGRTGTMAAAYLVATGRAGVTGALRRNLAVGPPSLEQVVFVVGLDAGARPPLVIRAASRIIDAPRRLWGFLRSPDAT